MARVQDIQLLIVRCGDTLWDKSGRLAGGGSELPLCEEGRVAMRSIADRLSGSSLGVVVGGKDPASEETTGLVSGATGAKVRLTDELGEVSLGLWEGLLLAELEDRFPTVYRQWKDSPEGVLVPQGESIEEARRRLIEAIGRVLSRTRGVGKGVGMVLRPMAYLIVRSWLRGESIADVWTKQDEIPDMEWHCVPRLKLRGQGTAPNGASSRAKAS